MTKSTEKADGGQAGSAVRISFNENNLQFWFQQKILSWQAEEYIL